MSPTERPQLGPPRRKSAWSFSLTSGLKLTVADSPPITAATVKELLVGPSAIRSYAALLLEIGLAACMARETVIPLPFDGSVVRIQVWQSFDSDGRYEAVVETPSGSAQHLLWNDWGPAQRANLYLTHDRRLVVIGGGGQSEMFSLPPHSPPKWVPYNQRPRESGDDWTYLGATAVDHRVPQEECIALFGAGSSPYRKAHQSEHSC